MELRNFQIEVPGKGTIDVEFTLHFNNNTVFISDIKIHSDFESDLPHRAQLALHDNMWQLHIQHPEMKDNEIVVVDKYLNDGYCKEILAKLLEIKDEAKVR